MIPQWLFPSVSISLNIGSAVVCWYHGDIRRTIYWIAAAVLTSTVVKW